MALVASAAVHPAAASSEAAAAASGPGPGFRQLSAELAQAAALSTAKADEAALFHAVLVRQQAFLAWSEEVEACLAARADEAESALIFEMDRVRFEADQSQSRQPVPNLEDTSARAERKRQIDARERCRRVTAAESDMELHRSKCAALDASRRLSARVVARLRVLRSLSAACGGATEAILAPALQRAESELLTASGSSSRCALAAFAVEGEAGSVLFPALQALEEAQQKRDSFGQDVGSVSSSTTPSKAVAATGQAVDLVFLQQRVQELAARRDLLRSKLQERRAKPSPLVAQLQEALAAGYAELGRQGNFDDDLLGLHGGQVEKTMYADVYAACQSSAGHERHSESA